MLTVLMATHNGSTTLPRVLESYGGLVPPHGGWRLIVVDNASTDGTREVLRRFATRLPLLAIHTEKRGKNVALNAGIERIEGDLVVFTDDDAIPDADWLSCLQQAAALHMDYDVFGGHIRAIWPGQPPDWIRRSVDLGAVYAVTPARRLSGPTLPGHIWGPNMAVRRNVFALGHRFDEGFGPQPGQYVMGGEVEFLHRIARQGHRAWFVGNATVGHIIRPHQLERSWILERAHRLGKYMYHSDKTRLASLAKAMVYWKRARMSVEQAARWLGTLAKSEGMTFSAEWRLAFLEGYRAEATKSRGAH